MTDTHEPITATNLPRERRSVDVMRQAYRPLNDAEQSAIATVKRIAAELYDVIDGLPGSREHSLAKTKIEEAVMWAVKGITSGGAA